MGAVAKISAKNEAHTVSPHAPTAPRSRSAREAAYEREADSMAARLGSVDTIASVAPRSLGATTAPTAQAVPADLRSVVDAPGQPIPGAVRKRLEPTFGVDFSGVRIHDDAPAQRAARAAGALACTWNHHILFAQGRFLPESSDGLALLAHELAHVTQSARGAPPSLRCKPDPAAPTVAAKWYQEAIDQVALSNQRMDEQRRAGGPVIEPGFYDTQKALLALCEAVDAKDKEATPKRLADLLKVGLWVHMQLLSRELLTELSARMFELGLEADAERLRSAYAQGERIGPHDPDIYAARRKIDFFTRLVSGASADAKADVPAAIAAAMHRYARVFRVLRDAYLAIDFKALADERRFDSGRYVLRPMMSREEYYDAVREQIERWHRGWSAFVQVALDTARTDLESPRPAGTGAALLLALRTAMVGELKGVLYPADEAKDISTRESFEITKTTMRGPGRGEIGDAFDPSSKSRRVPVTTYDPEQEWARELRTSIDHSYGARIDQIQVLARLYGVVGALAPGKDAAETKRSAEQATSNAQSIRDTSSGRLRLDSDDDWRAFLLRKYHDLTKATPATGASAATGGATTPTRAPLKPAEALQEIVALLFDYLKAFTVHARYTNLYDVGTTPYFNRPFPRALTGQLVHDCGVYALRAAYTLSLVRKELKLRFYFVRLPAHVSLVIAGEPGTGLPTFVIENNQYRVWESDLLAKRRKQWQAFQDPQTDKPPPGAADDKQFIGELAASDFIIGRPEMPLRVTEVPKPVTNAKAEQRQLWAYYQGGANADVFGPASQRKGDPNYLFHQHYLALTEQAREMHNEVFLPFWNQAAPATWTKFVAALEASKDKQPARTSLKVAELLTHVQSYSTALHEALQPVQERVDRHRDEQRRIGERLRADPKLARPDVRISAGLRAALFVRYGWEWYVEQLVNYEVDLLGRGGEEDEPVDAVKKALQPGWVPTEEKRMVPLD